MKPVLSIVPLDQQSRQAATVSNARLQAIKAARWETDVSDRGHVPPRPIPAPRPLDEIARNAEGQIPVGYTDDLSPFSEADRLALRNLGVAILIAGVVLIAVAAVMP